MTLAEKAINSMNAELASNRIRIAEGRVRIAALEAENAALRQHAEAMATVSEEPDIDSWERLASATTAYRHDFPKE